MRWLITYLQLFYQKTLEAAFTLANLASFLTIVTLMSFVYIGYSIGVIPLRLALYLMYSLIVFTYYKIIIKSLQFTIPKLQFIWSAVHMFLPIYGIIILEMLGLGDGFLLIALEINEALNKKPVEEVDRIFFEDFERIEPKEIEAEEGAEEEEEVEKKTPEFKTGTFLFGLALLITFKVVVLMFY